MANGMKKYDLEAQLKELGLELGQLTDEITRRAKDSMGLLQQQIYGKIVEKANEKLKSTREIYLKNLGMINDQDNLWVVYLEKPADFIETGIPQGEMIDRILNGGKPAKTGKNGRYKIIPFKHNKAPAQTSRAQMKIQNVVKRELKARGLDKPIMVNGKPKLGRAATLNLTGPGMPTTKFNQPILTGLTIYQREHKTKTGKTLIKRDVMTFRVISDSQKGSGMWEHPGSKGMNFFEEVSKDVDQMWSEMLKTIIDQVKIQNNNQG